LISCARSDDDNIRFDHRIIWVVHNQTSILVLFVKVVLIPNLANIGSRSINLSISVAPEARSGCEGCGAGFLYRTHFTSFLSIANIRRGEAFALGATKLTRRRKPKRGTSLGFRRSGAAPCSATVGNS
jgi:hypothetical protein